MAGLEFHVSAENRDFLNKLNQVQSKVSETTKKVEKEGNEIDAIFKKIGTSMAALGASFSATKLISDIVRVRGEFQQLEIAMETMLGSQEKATALMSQLTATAAKTPFGLTDIAQGAKQLLAYGTASEEVNDTLVRLGNIASGLSIPLNDLVYLYGTTMTQGRLFTQDLRQFMGRGIPLADELAKQFGVTKDKVGELVTEGKVGFAEVEKAIQSLTNEGGKFYNLMEKQSASLTGQISNLEDAWDMMLNEIGTKTQGLASGAIQVASTLIDNYEKVGRILLEIAGTYGTYKAALAAATAIQKVNTLVMEEAAIQIKLAAMAHHNLTIQQAKAIARTNLLTMAKKKLLATMKGLGKALTNPYVLAAAAVTALGFGIYKLVTYQTEAEKAQKRLNDAFSEASASAGSEIKKLDELKGRLSAAKKGSAEYYEIKDEIVKNFGKYDSTLADEIERVGDLSTKYDALTTAIQNSANARMYDKYVQNENERYDKDITTKLTQLRERIYGREGISTEDAARTYSKIWQHIFQGEALDEETEKLISNFDEQVWVYDQFGNRVRQTANSIRDYIRFIGKANEQHDQFIDNARETFGLGAYTSDFNAGLKKLTEEQLNQTKEELNAVLAKFRETKQEQEYSLVSGEAITFATEQQINDAINNVDAYLEKIKAARDNDKPTDEPEEDAIKKASKTQEKVEEALRKAEHDLSKAQTEDEIKLIEIERDAKIQALEDELEAYKAIYEAAGKDTKLLEEQFARMIDIEKQMADIDIKEANKKKSDKTKEELDELLKEFETYQQAVTRIEKEYDDKRKKMYESDGKTFKAGFDEGNITELERKKKEAIEDIAETYAGKSEAFESWADSLSSIAIDKLKQMLALAKAQLQILKNTEGADELEIANVEASISNLESVISSSDDTTKKSSTNWTELNKVLNECADSFSEIGGIIPGLAGEILSGVGQISSAAVGVANGINAIGEATSAAEKASAILAVISSVIKVVEKFTSLAEKNEEANNNAADAARNYAEALRDISEASDIEKNDTVFGKNVLGELIANANKAKNSLTDINKLLEQGVVVSEAMNKVDTSWIDVNNSGVPGVDDSVLLEGDFLLDQTIDAKKYGTQLASDMRTGWQQFWGMDKNQSVFDLSTLINDGLGFSITDFINEDKFREFEAWYEQWGDGLTDENKIIAEQILQEWDDYQEAMEQIKENVKSFFSNVSSSVVDSMLDKWIETGNAIADVTALVGDYATALAKASAESFLLEKVFNTAEQDMLDLMMRGDTEGATRLVKDLIEEANEYAPEIAKIFEAINEASAGALENTAEGKSEREAYRKDGITASQESVDKVDARLTTMQGHTYSISESCKMTATFSSQMVSRLTAIERNTSYLLGILERMQSLSSDIEDIKNKGIPMI